MVFEEIFNGPTPVFVASFVPKLFTSLLGQTQCECTIVISTLSKFCVESSSSDSDVEIFQGRSKRVRRALFSSGKAAKMVN